MASVCFVFHLDRWSLSALFFTFIGGLCLLVWFHSDRWSLSALCFTMIGMVSVGFFCLCVCVCDCLEKTVQWVVLTCSRGKTFSRQN